MIILDDNYVIDADECQYILKRKIPATAKDGTPKYNEFGHRVYNYKPLGYFGNLFHAFKSWYDELNRETVKTGSMSLTDALKTISENAAKVNKAFRDALPEIEDVRGDR